MAFRMYNFSLSTFCSFLYSNCHLLISFRMYIARLSTFCFFLYSNCHLLIAFRMYIARLSTFCSFLYSNCHLLIATEKGAWTLERSDAAGSLFSSTVTTRYNGSKNNRYLHREYMCMYGLCKQPIVQILLCTKNIRTKEIFMLF